MTRKFYSTSISGALAQQNTAATLYNKALVKGGFHNLGSGDKKKAISLLTNEQMENLMSMGKSSSSNGSTPSSSSSGSGTETRGLSADDLLKSYQQGLTAQVGNVQSGPSMEDTLKKLEKTYELDAKRMRQEQDLEIEGQEKQTRVAREARAAEKKQDEEIRASGVRSDRQAALSAFKNF